MATLAPYPCGHGDNGDTALLGIFGTSVLVVKKVWELLERDSLLPEDGRPKHLLWALHFMKEYPKQSPGCSAAGTSAGAVSPKTNRKWAGLGVYRRRRQPGRRCGKKLKCEDRCRNDIVLKCLGHSIAWCRRQQRLRHPLQTPDSNSKNPCFRSLCRCLFPPTSGPHPPDCLREQVRCA